MTYAWVKVHSQVCWRFSDCQPPTEPWGWPWSSLGQLNPMVRWLIFATQCLEEKRDAYRPAPKPYSHRRRHRLLSMVYLWIQEVSMGTWASSWMTKNFWCQHWLSLRKFRGFMDTDPSQNLLANKHVIVPSFLLVQFWGKYQMAVDVVWKWQSYNGSLNSSHERLLITNHT